MKKIIFSLGIALLLSQGIKVKAQEVSNADLLKRIEALEAEKNKAKEWDISIYGWVRTDYIFDSRQSLYVREYNLNLYPLDKSLDINGNDVNATGSSNFLSITSRLGVKFKGPDVWGAKATGNLEGDFFGNTELNKSTSGTGSTGLFRLRHAYATLDWGKTAITFGQTWYPSFIPEVMPGVVNFNTGIMFNPFGWAGQMKFSQKITPELSFIAVAYKDREFQTATASGASANSATFNSLVPTFHGQLQYKGKKIMAGIAAEYQSLKPIISTGASATSTTTSTLLEDNQKVNSTNFIAYFKYTNSKIIAKLYGITGGNLNHLVMLGGFAGYKDSITGQESYKPTKTSAFWLDLASTNTKVAPGIFFGYTKNGGVDAGYTNLYIRGNSGTRIVDHVWRASARVEFKQNKFNIAPELEYTAAKWGDTNSEAKAGNNTTTVGNFRGMVRVMYSF